MKALVEPGRSTQGSSTSAPTDGEPIILQITHGLSHETRNALNALAIHLEVLRDKLRDQIGGTIPPHLEKNLRASRAQVSKLSDALTRFSEFVSMQHEPIDLGSALVNAAKLCSLQLRRADIELNIDFPETIRVSVEPSLLQQILVEGLLAAAALLPPCRLRITGSIDGDSVLIHIRDDRRAPFKAGGAPPPLQVMGREEEGEEPPLRGVERGALTMRRLPIEIGALETLRDRIEAVGGSLRHRRESGGCELSLPLAGSAEHGSG